MLVGLLGMIWGDLMHIRISAYTWMDLMMWAVVVQDAAAAPAWERSLSGSNTPRDVHAPEHDMVWELAGAIVETLSGSPF